jgi:hypothetical protein
MMNPFMMVAVGFVAGLGFGLLVAWGMLGFLVAGVGAALMLAGALFPSSFRVVFTFAVFGFVVAFIAAGGITLL